MSQIVINLDKQFDKSVMEVVKGRMLHLLRDNKTIKKQLQDIIQSHINYKMERLNIESLVRDVIAKHVVAANPYRQRMIEELIAKQIKEALKPSEKELQEINDRNIKLLFKDELKKVGAAAAHNDPYVTYQKGIAAERKVEAKRQTDKIYKRKPKHK